MCLWVVFCAIGEEYFVVPDFSVYIVALGVDSCMLKVLICFFFLKGGGER